MKFETMAQSPLAAILQKNSDVDCKCAPPVGAQGKLVARSADVPDMVRFKRLMQRILDALYY